VKAAPSRNFIPPLLPVMLISWLNWPTKETLKLNLILPLTKASTLVTRSTPLGPISWLTVSSSTLASLPKRDGIRWSG
jgi:hypothetical protein